LAVVETIFWFCLVFIAYTYLGYPLALKIASIFVREYSAEDSTTMPSVTLIISVYNEEKVIRSKIENSLALNYPKEKLEIVVASDGSTDLTDEIVKSYQKDGVILNETGKHRGKTATLNCVVPPVKGNVIVFTDANTHFAKDTIKKLVKHFSREEIGFVTGYTMYRSHQKDKVSETTGIYSKYELFLKRKESKISSCVGADGAVFAVRRDLCEPLKDDDINDFALPLKIIRKGHRGVLEQGAIAYEEPSPDMKGEFRRQVRITNRTLRAIFSNIDLLNPFKFPIFSWQLSSHKLLRFITPFCFILLFISNLLLVPARSICSLFLAVQVIFYALALFGYLLDRAKKTLGAISAPYYFVLMNIAVSLGWVRCLSGRPDILWQHERIKR
jgi:cellulose synthase/poly-beta-1,6-N-acetylglucosamine synthase-like glycosyltransferase